MAKKRRVKRRYTRLYDLLFNIELFICICIALFRIVQVSIIPTKFIILVVIAFVIIFLIFFLTMFIKLPKIIFVIKQIVLNILCFILIFFSNSLSNITNAVDQISSLQSNPYTNIFLVVDSKIPIKTLEDLKKEKDFILGVQQGSDIENVDFAFDQMVARIGYQPNIEIGKDYQAIANLFRNQMIQGFLISESYLDMLNANYEDFKKSYRIIETYKKENQVHDSDFKNVQNESFTLLISGVDEVGIADQSSLSDVNILLFVNPRTNQLTMVSLPRDSYVPHAYFQGINDKLTHTGAYGINNTVKTLEDFFDITIDYYTKVNFSSLIEIVDQIGGIDVDVEISFTEQDEHRSFAEEDLIHLEKGFQHLNGKQALAYARHRKSENYDIAGRERAQERIIQAIVKKLVSIDGIKYINGLLENVPKYIMTNMPAKQINAFIKGELNQISPWSIRSITLSNGVYDTRNVPNLDVPQDVYLWNVYDYKLVKDAYELNQSDYPLKDFNFDLADMNLYLPKINSNANIVWSVMALDPH